MALDALLEQIPSLQSLIKKHIPFQKMAERAQANAGGMGTAGLFVYSLAG